MDDAARRVNHGWLTRMRFHRSEPCRYWWRLDGVARRSPDCGLVYGPPVELFRDPGDGAVVGCGIVPNLDQRSSCALTELDRVSRQRGEESFHYRNTRSSPRGLRLLALCVARLLILVIDDGSDYCEAARMGDTASASCDTRASNGSVECGCSHRYRRCSLLLLALLLTIRVGRKASRWADRI